jgi:hypothetical protein
MKALPDQQYFHDLLENKRQETINVTHSSVFQDRRRDGTGGNIKAEANSLYEI